ncbi:MAG: T9SS type A sorting domain-containing protein, partial [Bacteroidota bacterium]
FNTSTVGTYRYRYMVTDANGCSATDSILIDVKPKAVAGTLQADQLTFCAGDSTTLRVFGSVGTLSWESSSTSGGPWGPAAVTRISDTTAFTGPLSSTTFYRVTAKLENCSAIGTEIMIEVIALPAKPLLNLLVDSICSGDSTFLVTTNYTSGILWNDPAITIDDTLVVRTTGVYFATATAAGCENRSDSAFVTVSNNPDTPVITANGANPACDGDIVTLVSSASGNNSWSSGETADSITVATTGTFTVTHTNASGCSATSASFEMVFNPSPVKPSIALIDSGAICMEDSVRLVVTPAGSNTWSTGSTADTIVVRSTGVYTVTAANSFGCEVVSDDVEITFNSLPTRPVITSADPFCLGNTVQLQSSGTGTNTWSDNSTSDSLAVTSNGTYTVTVTDSNGCSRVSAPYEVTFDSIPAKPVITQMGNQLTASGNAAAYQWFDDNGPISGANAKTYSPTHSGMHSVTAYSAQGCASPSSGPFAFSGVGVAEVSALSGVKLYPNPSPGAFTIFVAQDAAFDAYRITDLSGRIITGAQLVKGNNQVNTGLSAGVYIVELLNNTVVSAQGRLVIQ